MNFNILGGSQLLIKFIPEYAIDMMIFAILKEISFYNALNWIE